MKKIIKYVGTGLVAQILPAMALAQTTGTGVALNKDKITSILDTFATWFSGIIGILGILVMLYAAFLYMTAGGDEEKIGSAKRTLIYGLVGVGIAIIAFGVFGLVTSFLQ